MNKKELIARSAKNSGLSQKIVANALDSILLTIEEALTVDDDVLLVGFGKFHNIDCIPRVGRHPSNGRVLMIPAKRKVRFAASKTLSQAVLK